jgi:hypothetical protein
MDSNGTPQPQQPDTWTIADLIDFEVALAVDGQVARKDASGLVERDREIYKSVTKDASETLRTNRRWVFRQWVEALRAEQHEKEDSSGKAVALAFEIIEWMLLGVGLFVGISTVVTYIHSAPADPGAATHRMINLNWFVPLFVGVPFVISLYGFWVMTVGKAFPRLPRAPMGLKQTFSHLLLRAGNFLARTGGISRAMDLEKLGGVIKMRISGREDAVLAQLLATAQCLGIGFTIGVGVASMFLLAGSDCTFRWGNTWRVITAQDIHSWVRILSAPWEAFSGIEDKFPTLEQVVQTGPSTIPVTFPAITVAADAWSGFVIRTSWVYGFLPRAVLYLLTRFHLRRSLGGMKFDELRFDTLWRRMSGPTVAMGQVGCAVVIPTELDHPGRKDAVKLWLHKEKGWQMESYHLIDALAGDKIASMVATGARSCHRLLFVQESFMPPALAVLDFVGDLRSLLGKDAAILIGLLGKPDGEPFGHSPRALDLKIWEDKILTLGDTNIETIPLKPQP